MKINFIVSGVKVPTRVSKLVNLGVGLYQALVESKNVHRTDWEIRDVSGALLDPMVRIKDLHLEEGVFLYVSPPAGVGA